VSIYSTEIYKKNRSGLCVCALYYIDDTIQLLSWLLVETMEKIYGSRVQNYCENVFIICFRLLLLSEQVGFPSSVMTGC
jgi:hypothetical protein